MAVRQRRQRAILRALFEDVRQIGHRRVDIIVDAEEHVLIVIIGQHVVADTVNERIRKIAAGQHQVDLLRHRRRRNLDPVDLDAKIFLNLLPERQLVLADILLCISAHGNGELRNVVCDGRQRQRQKHKRSEQDEPRLLFHGFSSFIMF